MFAGMPPEEVSIHAPTRGATQMLLSRWSVGFSFQSTRPRGARRSGDFHHAHKAVVSIHAPTRGATAEPHGWRTLPGGFNPRAHAGRDRIAERLQGRQLAFQSTRPRGARPWLPCFVRTRHSGFNPRAHAGRDCRRNPPCCLPGRCFNPRAHAGRDMAHEALMSSLQKFQSTRPRGARRARDWNDH